MGLAGGTVTFDHNLPAQRTSFVGREAEVEETVELLERCRLVTLTGLGGTGKTRLALEVAARAGLDHETVRLVELASLEAPAGVAAAMREVLPWPGPAGRRDAVADLLAAIGDRRLLLVVDNCEHLLGEIARLVHSCLDGCRNLTVLATSREPLHVAGEHVRVVRPLSLDRKGERDLSPAVQLFIDRAGAVCRELPLDDETIERVEHICRHLDGIPLAIELGAARAAHLTPAEIAARLDARLGVLASRDHTPVARHRTLTATLDWSYDLLTPQEQAVFRRMACFAAPVTLDAIEAVVSDADLPREEVLDVTAALVDRSLLVAEHHERVTRYRLLETVRRYAFAKLEEATELRRARAAHARWSVGLVERAGSIARLAPAEQQEVIAALHWAVADRHELAVALAGRSWQWWEVTGRPAEGRRLLESILASTDASPSLDRSAVVSGAAQLAFIAGELDVAASLHEINIGQLESLGSPALAARSRNSLAVVQLYQGDLDAAEQLAARSLEDFDHAGDVVGVAYVRSTLGLVATARHRVDDAVAQLLESVRLLRREGRRQDAASVLTNLGNVAQDHNDLARAHRFYEGALQLQTDVGDDRGMALSLNNLSIVAGQRGDVDHAWEFADRALAIFRAIGDRPGEAASLNNLANFAVEQGQHRRALELYWGAVERYRDLRDGRGTTTSLANLADLALLCGEAKLAWRCAIESLALSVSFGKPVAGSEALQTLRSVSEATGLSVVAELEAAIEAGSRPRLEKVLDLLRATEVPSSLGTDSPQQPSQLTRREGQVTALVARGLANKEVAAELFISERTVDSHISHIRTKLGIDSRTQLVRWAVDHGLG